MNGGFSQERNSTRLTEWRMRFEQPSSCFLETRMRPMIPMSAVQSAGLEVSGEWRLATQIMELELMASSSIFLYRGS